MPARRYETDERFALYRSRCERVDGHWMWPVTNWAGYAKGAVSVGLHRWMYEAVNGPIPDGLELDHVCRVRNCINPDHMEPVTSSENKRRAHAARGVYDQCPAGHPRSAPPPGGRIVCRECKRDERRARVARGIPETAVHGRTSTYSLGCRCEPCKDARRTYDQSRREAKSAEVYQINLGVSDDS